MSMNLTPIQMSAVLAGLRLLQRADTLPADIDSILTNDGAQPRIAETDIDALCEQINCADPVRAVVAMEGGVIQNVSADGPLELLLVDYDVEMVDEDGIIDVPQTNSAGVMDGTEKAYVAGVPVEADQNWVELQFTNWEAAQSEQDEGQAG